MSTLSLSTFEKLPEVAQSMNIDTMLKLYRTTGTGTAYILKGPYGAKGARH
jgi:alpha-D-ribose 1-methylphosphonate 5-triphosphate synthase subunit PhnG